MYGSNARRRLGLGAYVRATLSGLIAALAVILAIQGILVAYGGFSVYHIRGSVYSTAVFIGMWSLGLRIAIEQRAKRSGSVPPALPLIGFLSGARRE